ncbi:hypothetical protein CEN41_15800 [Fischerella thermalis CCMEE 5330]|uniref:Uncharacterized protein n=1 Tax=Fischerella thermalis CCMEE 5330 TaxID=2019670 RepID=A0A2N6M614_9CYAN|nr:MULTISPECIES: hypothetical protein [Fischerella]PMB42187.1 hypothetical protein CEN41_15800 [Fischerella thermalis CCMEE 5330]BAU07223.1 unknown protein [Fischerella sp. NIES-3754]BCX09548.1 MAG: hypothetical protein KatS3mg066_3407 [Fischerella sp.]
MANNEAYKKGADTSDRVRENKYDPHIVPAETAARKEREGDLFKTLPTEKREANATTDDQTHPGDSIRTTDGYTVDKEGLLNNYAVEPEMYYEVPGDARQQAEEDTAHRVEELTEINEDKQGELTMEGDKRGKGPGVV